VFWSPDGKYVAAYGGVRATSGYIAGPPMAAIPIDQEKVLSINSFRAPSPTHSPEIRYLKHATEFGNLVFSWAGGYGYNWVPD